MWAALTALFVVLLVAIVASVVWLMANVISFLQPILIPVAIAAILAYLLDPLVTKLCRGGMSRTKAVVLIFAMAFFALSALIAWLVPMISIQSANFAKELPSYTEKARDRIVDLIYRYDRAFGMPGATRGKSPSPTNVAVFTAMEGTLLGRDTFDAGSNRALLQRLDASGVSVIPVTVTFWCSCTHRQVASWRTTALSSSRRGG